MKVELIEQWAKLAVMGFAQVRVRSRKDGGLRGCRDLDLLFASWRVAIAQGTLGNRLVAACMLLTDSRVYRVFGAWSVRACWHVRQPFFDSL